MCLPFRVLVLGIIQAGNDVLKIAFIVNVNLKNVNISIQLHSKSFSVSRLLMQKTVGIMTAPMDICMLLPILRYSKM